MDPAGQLPGPPTPPPSSVAVAEVTHHRHHPLRRHELTHFITWLGIDAAITDAGVAHISVLRALECLKMDRCNALTNAAFASVGSLTNLRELDLQDCSRSIDDDGIADMKTLKNVEYLTIKICPAITDVGLGTFVAFPWLRNLYLEKCDVGGKELTAIAEMHVLESLSLVHCHGVTDNGIRSALELQHLETIDLTGCIYFTDDGLATIAAIRQLRSLKLSYCHNITDEGIETISVLKWLETLFLKDCRALTDASISFFIKMRSLSTLDISETKLNLANSDLQTLRASMTENGGHMISNAS